MPLSSRQAPKRAYAYVVPLDADDVESLLRSLRSVIPDCSPCTRDDIFTHVRTAPQGSARVVFVLAPHPVESSGPLASLCTQASQDTLFVLLSPASDRLFDLIEAAGLFDWADIEDPPDILERHLQLIWRNAKRALNLQIEAAAQAATGCAAVGTGGNCGAGGPAAGNHAAGL